MELFREAAFALIRRRCGRPLSGLLLSGLLLCGVEEHARAEDNPAQPIVSPPINTSGVLENLNSALRQDLLIRKDFYGQETLRSLLGGDEWSEVSDRESVSLRARGPDFRSAERRGSGPPYSTQYAVLWKRSVNGKAQAFLNLSFDAPNEVGLNEFAKIFEISHRGWQRDQTPLPPIPPDWMKREPVRVSYFLNDARLKRSLFAVFDGENLFLENLQVREEEQ